MSLSNEVNTAKPSTIRQSRSMVRSKFGKFWLLSLLACTSMVSVSCSESFLPDARSVNIPAPMTAPERKKSVAENGESVIYLPLGEDILLPQSQDSDPLPDTIVGPFELRGETLAGALQLIMDGVDVPVAFESTSSLTQEITVTNLKGPLGRVVNDVCSLANMYCSFKGGVLSVKDREVFTVSIPPIVSATDMTALLNNISAAIESITGEKPITDPSTRTIVYRASQRTAEMAKRYFQKLRASTALIVYETYIWEVSLSSDNSTGIKWSALEDAGRFKFGLNLAGSVDTKIGSPISIGLPTTKEVEFTSSDILQFISKFGAVKTISQPQITVLSGASAKFRISDKESYVSSISKTTDSNGENPTYTTATASADSGFTISIASNWDNSTVYGTVGILLQEVKDIVDFSAGDSNIQLPITTERELNTSVRVRPGDTLLIGGLVKENDNYSKEGVGLDAPLIPTSRTTKAANTELVFLMKPRVVVFIPKGQETPRKETVDPVPALPEASFTQPTAMQDTAAIPAFELVPETPAPETAPPVAAVPEIAPPVAAIPEEPAQPVLDVPALPDEPATSSIEIQPLPQPVPETASASVPEITPPVVPTVNATQKGKSGGDPSVIVNYDVLGK